MSRQRMWQIGAAAVLVVLMLFGVGYYVITSDTSTASDSAITDTTPPVDPDPSLTTTAPETTPAPLPQTVSGKGTQGSTGIVQNSGGTVQNPPSGPSASQMLEPYLGEWWVHGSTLDISADGTGTEKDSVGQCDPSATGEDSLCNQINHLALTASPTGLTAKITSVSYVKWNGSPAPEGFAADPSIYKQKGDSFTLVREGHLLRTTYQGRISSWNNNETHNPNWCDQDWANDIANRIPHPECGA